MSTISFSRRFYLYLLNCLLVIPLFLSTAAISCQDTQYIYFGEDRSNIAELISQLKSLDGNNNSPLYQLHEYVTRGPRLVEYDAVVEALAYAEGFLQKNKQLDPAQVKKIGYNLDRIIDQVLAGELTVSKDQDIAHKRTLVIPASLDLFDLDTTPVSLFAKRLVALTPALVVSTSNVTLSGLQTIDGVALVANNRVLLVNQTTTSENGLWLAQSGSWTRPTDFATGNAADQAYVLISSGSVNAGSSWLCTTPTAVIDTDPITFVLFSYPDVNLTGDVTGTLGASVVSLVGGQTAADVATATILANAATNSNTASTIVKRDASGNFAAGIITASDAVLSNSLTVTPFSSAGVVHNNSSGVLSSSLIVNADISASAAISDSKLATLTTAGKVANAATTANSSNLANAIVTRDASGNFAAGTITASLSGNATSATSATTATTAGDFTGSLSGDVTGTQSATVVSFVGGQAAANVATATTLAIGATSNNTANAIVKRNASGNFSAGAVSITDAVISSSLTVTPLSTAGVVHNNTSGLFSSSLIVNADISASAAIADTKLATISTAGKISNSATTATSLNTANAIVARDASGNINASYVIANLIGNASDNVLRAGDTMTGALQVPAGTAAAPSLKFTGSTTTGFSTSSSNLIISTSGSERMRVSSGGTVSIKAFTSAGVVKNDASGNLSSSLIVDSNIASGANIVDTKLSTISTSGKVANSATTATSSNVANTIINRDVSGNFAANQATVVDVIASGSLYLSTDPSTSTAGNIFKGVSTPFIHDYGTDNTFLGLNAGNFTMTGNGQNTIMGSSAFTSNSSGDNNTGVGFAILPACTTGSNNIAVGSGAGGTLATGSGNIYINANASSTSESSTTRIGTSQTKCFMAGIRGITTGNANAIAVLIDSAGQLGTVSSSQKVKHDIEDIGDESHSVLNLRPVKFVYNGDESDTKQYGLIAEEVNEILPEIVVKDEQGQPETVQYHILPVLLLNEMKKQQAKVDQMEQVIASLQSEIEQFIARVKTLENRA